MIQFPENITFKYSWRSYQQRVLDQLSHHIRDRRLHVVAPPGSGKTVLGLEVALRLNHPTLIIAPTLAIRNQWIARFCDLFLQTTTTPNWISKDIRNPKFLTVITYQGLHAACSASTTEEINTASDLEPEEEDDITTYSQPATLNENLEFILKLLVDQKVKTIVVDEMHHLRNEWWHTLHKVINKLNPFVVGLTATPPYDVSSQEWNRYIALSGPIDIEIAVPELVKAADLCPHQDYIHLSLPDTQEQEQITAFRARMESLYDSLQHDPTLINAIQQHPAILNPDDSLSWIYSNISEYASLLVYLTANNIIIPVNHLKILGDKNVAIPALNANWLAVLLTHYLFDKVNFINFEEQRKSLEHTLRKAGALEHNTISFENSSKLSGLLNTSIGKLNSIEEIAHESYATLGDELRMVVLTDYIRKEYLTDEPVNTIELKKIGVLSIFEKLRRAKKEHWKLGVLTGSIIIIPFDTLTHFNELLATENMTEVNHTELPYDNAYIQIKCNDLNRHKMVAMVTALFQAGHIQILTGTKALLGEGWDAPAINTLVLASFVGSFVQSNQMRGRAIRTQQSNPKKTSAIWHLVCIDASDIHGGADLVLLTRRFKTFVGISNHKPITITNGLGRIRPQVNILNKQDVTDANNKTIQNAKNRDTLKKNWQIGITNGMELVEEIQIPFSGNDYRKLINVNYTRSIATTTATLFSGFIGFFSDLFITIVQRGFGFSSFLQINQFVMVFGGMGFVVFGGFSIKYIGTYLRYKNLKKDIAKMGLALLETLKKTGDIQANLHHIKINTTIDSNGTISCYLQGCTSYEKSLFLDCMHQLLAPITNPRYVIEKKSHFLNILNPTDYYAVPDLIGKNKKIALHFANKWKEHVGNCNLIFTRHIEGRHILVKARIAALSGQFKDTIERHNIWR